MKAKMISLAVFMLFWLFFILLAKAIGINDIGFVMGFGAIAFVLSRICADAYIELIKSR